MRQSFALFSRRLTPRLWVENWGVYAPAPEAAAPNAPPLQPYAFRKGSLWQPTKVWLLPAPPEQAAPDAPPLTTYVFRRGGFWQTQKLLVDRSPIDAIPSVPDQPLVPQYVFRKGRFWQITKSIQTDTAVIVPPPPPPPPPPPLIPAPTGGQLGRVVFDSNRFTSDRIRKIYNDLWYRDRDQARAMLLALLAADAISEEEFTALFAAMSAQ